VASSNRTMSIDLRIFRAVLGCGFAVGALWNLVSYLRESLEKTIDHRRLEKCLDRINAAEIQEHTEYS
jgi:hypothetical protein